jgi:hypothetical protein
MFDFLVFQGSCRGHGWSSVEVEAKRKTVARVAEMQSEQQEISLLNFRGMCCNINCITSEYVESHLEFLLFVIAISDDK